MYLNIVLTTQRYHNNNNNDNDNNNNKNNLDVSLMLICCEHKYTTICIS